MTTYLQISLCIISASTLVFILLKIRRSQIEIGSSIYWILTSAVLIALSIFPGIAGLFADVFGFQSPANFIIVAVIFLLSIKVFALSIQLSEQKRNIKQMAQKMAMLEYKIRTVIPEK